MISNIKNNKISTCMGLGFSYLFIEYYVYKKRKTKLETQKTVTFYNGKKIQEIKSDIAEATDLEKEDISETISEIDKNNSNTINDILKKNQINCNKVLHIPIVLEFCFGIYNYYIYKKLSNKYTINTYKKHGNTIYYINSNNNIDIINRKKIILLSGLSESFVQIYKILNLILDSGIDVIFPVYGPSKFSFGNDLNQNVYDYCFNIIEYLNFNEIIEIDIIAWSLGCVKYLCFDELLKENSSNSKNIKLRYVYLFEPLLTTRSIFDVYVAHNRSFLTTFKILNKRTFNLTTKYKFYNILMSYVLHSHLVISTANSSHFLYHTEHKKSITKYINNNRYLFLSESDFLCNTIADKKVIENKFNSNNIFIRPGYHGGYLKSNKLNTIFIPLLIKNLNKK